MTTGPDISYDPKDDSDLIRKLNDGDKEAFTELYDKYVGKVYGFLYKTMKDEAAAEDLTQFCFMQIWINRKKISTNCNFPAYLYVTARNSAYKEFRKQIVTETYINSAIRNETNYQREDYGNVDFKLIEKEIAKFIKGLPEARKKIYVMSRIEGKKSLQISQDLGISIKTVEAQLSRVNIGLRKAISKIIIMIFVISLTSL